MSKKHKYSLEELRQAQEDLASVGLLRKTDELRAGRPVYEITEEGKRVAALYHLPDADVQ